MHRRNASQDGFTLIELLVVVLIIGILAAIALPSFLSQKSKATDSAAKEMVHSAQTAAETYATDHGGGYAGITAALLKQYEPSIVTTAGNNAAWLSEAKPEESNAGFKVTATSASGHTFSLTKKANGELERSCTPTGKTGAEGGGCQNSTW